MKKSLIASFGVLAMGLLLISSYALAGPPDETFGTIISAYMNDQATFNAFELGPITNDRCRGKGKIIYTATRSEGIYVYYLDVDYVNSQPDIGQAWFAGICYCATLNGADVETNVGRWFTIKVWDDGEGPPSDGLSANWVDAEEAAKTFVCEEGYKAFGPITSGDIVIQIHPPGQRKK